MINQKLAKTGDLCPISGEWLSLEDNASTVLMKKGEMMPPFKGRSINWQFQKSIDRSKTNLVG